MLCCAYVGRDYVKLGRADFSIRGPQSVHYVSRLWVSHFLFFFLPTYNTKSLYSFVSNKKNLYTLLNVPYSSGGEAALTFGRCIARTIDFWTLYSYHVGPMNHETKTLLVF